MRNTFFRGIFFAFLALVMMQPAEFSAMEEVLPQKAGRRMKAAKALYISDYKQTNRRRPTVDEIREWKKEWKRLRLERKEQKIAKREQEIAKREQERLARLKREVAASQKQRRLREEKIAARVEQQRLHDEALYAKPELTDEQKAEVMREARYLQSHPSRPLGNIEGMRPRARR
jgi:hypothetical protein